MYRTLPNINKLNTLRVNGKGKRVKISRILYFFIVIMNICLKV